MKIQKYVLGFLFAKDLNTVALINKTHPDWQKNKWNGIGGKILFNETTEDAMVRTFQKETNKLLPAVYWKEFATLQSDSYEVICYAARAIQWEDTYLETITEENVVWFNRNNIPNEVIPNLSYLLPVAHDKLSSDSTFQYMTVDYCDTNVNS
ncbi:MAG: hypothetical protein J0M18_19430 [Ignavibacteria bacterium]|nr:hypothetical protein [Ignavibacteria bacterium]